MKSVKCDRTQPERYLSLSTRATTRIRQYSSPATCFGLTEVVSHGYQSVSCREIRLVASATSLPTNPAGALSIVIDSRPEPVLEGGSQRQTADDIQSELLSLSLRQAEVQERIQQVRHALVALVHVFGPEILDAARKAQESDALDISRSRPKVTDILRRVLSQSARPLTFDQIFEAAQKEAPSILAGFINPGVSISNALRALQRHREIESCRDAHAVKWQWIVDVDFVPSAPAAEINPD